LALVVTILVTGAARPAGAISPRWERIARSLIGTPYVYGGSTPYQALDCSGFVRYVVGTVTQRWLPHSARGQAVIVPQASDIRPGDLLFFDYSGGGIHHVELALGHGEMIGTSNATEDADIDAIDWDALVSVGRVPGLAPSLKQLRKQVEKQEERRLEVVTREAILAALVLRT
jgi:cell wall-associated NlpC family hydrolase